MFTNIPPIQCLPLINDFLLKKKIQPVVIDEILNLFQVCVGQNYFSYNDKFYIQKDGLPMGSPISPILADLFMDNIENIIFNSILCNNLLFWYRYVDDILGCFVGSTRQLDIFHKFINSIHPKIKFKIENERDASINFSDLTITRKQNNFEYSIYRKPTHTNITIPADSNHPTSQKLSAYNSMIHRAFSVPLSTDDFNKEINIIKDIATSNGYSHKMINQMLEKKRFKLAINSIFPQPQKVSKLYTSLTYFGKLSEKVSKIITNSNQIDVAYRSHNSIGSVLLNVKHKPTFLEKSGIYKINCGECNAVYIGQTQRNLDIRYCEHLRAYRKKKPENSNFAKHLLEQNHKPALNNNIELLHSCENYNKLNFLESLEIKRYQIDPQYTLMNDQLDNLHSPLIDCLLND